MCVGGNNILFQIRLQRYNLIFLVSLQFVSELNNMFHVKGLKRCTFHVKLFDDRRKIEQEKY